jgi:hypothetical protein
VELRSVMIDGAVQAADCTFPQNHKTRSCQPRKKSRQSQAIGRRDPRWTLVSMGLAFFPTFPLDQRAEIGLDPSAHAFSGRWLRLLQAKGQGHETFSFPTCCRVRVCAVLHPLLPW